MQIDLRGRTASVMPMMSRDELRRAIGQAKQVFGWVKWTDNDGTYVQLQKGSLLRRLNDASHNEEFHADWRGKGKVNLYID